MSIQIGTTNIVSQLSPNDLNGRLVINSPTSSNLLSLTSQTPRTSITINSFSILRDNTDFHLQDNGSNFFTGNNSYVTLLPPTIINNVLTCCNVATFLTNVDVQGNTNVNQLNIASNVNVSVLTPNAPAIDVWRNNANLFSVNGAGNVSIASNALVLGSVTVSRSLAASNVATSIIQSPTITLKGNTLCQGSTQVNGDLTIQGALKYSGRLDISSNLSLTTIVVSSNVSTSQLNVDYTTPSASGNAMSCITRPFANTLINAMTIDSRGRFGIGTQTPSCLLDVQKNAFINDALLFQIGGVVVNSNSFVGIGTTNPRNHISVNVNISDASRSTMGISHTGNQRFFSATSNNSEVFRIGADGRMSVGEVNDSFGLYVAPRFTSRIPIINTDQIIGGTINCTSASLSNIANVTSSNMVSRVLTTGTLRSTNFTTTNFDVAGLTVSVDSSIVSSCNMQFQGNLFVLSKTSSDLSLSPTLEGKLRVEAQAVDGSVSRGVVVTCDKDTSVRVHSVSARPFFELTNGNALGMSIGMSPNGNMIMGESSRVVSTPAIDIDRNNKVKFFNNCEVNDNGIIITSKNKSTANHNVVGKTTFKNSIDEPVLFVSNNADFQRAVGIATTIPQYTLDVQGSIYGRDLSVFKSGIVLGTQVTSTDALRINSSTATSGIYIQNPGVGNAFTYETAATKCVINSTGNVGIGTLTALSPLHVNGVARFVQDDASIRLAPQSVSAQTSIGFYQSSTYTGNPWLISSTPDNKLNISKQGSINTNISFSPNGAVGIGITTPQYGFHVSSNLDGYFGCNLTIANIAYASQFTQTSDRSIKVNLEPISDALVKVNNLTGYTYFRTDMMRKEAGLIAQEVAAVLPEVVDTNNNNLMTIAYGNMASVFVQAIKELNAKVNSLEEQVRNLSGHKQ